MKEYRFPQSILIGILHLDIRHPPMELSHTNLQLLYGCHLWRMVSYKWHYVISFNWVVMIWLSLHRNGNKVVTIYKKSVVVTSYNNFVIVPKLSLCKDLHRIFKTLSKDDFQLSKKMSLVIQIHYKVVTMTSYDSSGMILKLSWNLHNVFTRSNDDFWGITNL